VKNEVNKMYQYGVFPPQEGIGSTDSAEPLPVYKYEYPGKYELAGTGHGLTSNSTLAKFKFRKHADQKGKPTLELIGWRNVRLVTEVPDEYLEEKPAFYQINDGSLYVWFDELSFDILPEETKVFSYEQYRYFIKQAKLAGERLAAINRKLKRKQVKARTEFEVTI